ncbi:tryptophan--tRNA ligase [Spiromyces aspiralis]|uniref:Tryptophan--tRNA ligase n=1 Tax=Spiromyces aspiralis TaxID=68401 RepID=A0ACC1HYC0_9FUNG|nr:tryptophan--tRNA ligase [Spiromyces aspiralis]
MTQAPQESLANLSIEENSATTTAEVSEQRVTPWEVEGAKVDGKVLAIDYDKLTEQFGTRKIDDELLARFERVTGHKPHCYLRRGIFFSHRDLGKILDRYEQGKPFYVYTGRGPSRGHMHIGHMMPFVFCKWLQDVFDVPLVIQLTDDEKFLFKNDLTLEQTYEYARNTVREIAAVGFRPEKTFIFSDLDYMNSAFYRNVLKVSRCITTSMAKATFGFKDSDSIGKLHFVSVEASPSFSNSFPQIFGGRKDIPCLIPCGIDQDPYFRLTRDVAQKLKYPKPSLIHAVFLPALQGPGSKMSSSIDSSAIFMDDSAAKIKNKINRHAFSGGGATLQEHREKGGNPDVDVPYQYLRFFLEDDDELLAIHKGYKRGEITTGEIKAICIRELQKFVGEFQERERAITPEQVADFMDPNYPRHFEILVEKKK